MESINIDEKVSILMIQGERERELHNLMATRRGKEKRNNYDLFAIANQGCLYPVKTIQKRPSLLANKQL